MNIGLLSTRNHPILRLLLPKLQQSGIRISSIFFDSKILSEASLSVLRERLGDSFGFISEKDLEGVRVHDIDHNSPDILDIIKSEEIDLLINAGTPRILKNELICAPKRGILNIHPGLLPKYRGCTCVEWAIYNEDQVGNTAHFMSVGIDEGPIILSAPVSLRGTRTYQEVRTKVLLDGLDLMGQAIKKIQAEDLYAKSLKPQAEGSYFSVIEDDKMKIVLEKIANQAHFR